MRGNPAFAAGQAGLKQYRIEACGEIQEIRVFGEWAYCWNKLSVIVTPLKGGATIKRAGDALSIPRKQAGKWVIYRDANRLAAVP
jgi:ketosteroid isomerase-like protein